MYLPFLPSLKPLISYFAVTHISLKILSGLQFTKDFFLKFCLIEVALGQERSYCGRWSSNTTFWCLSQILWPHIYRKYWQIALFVSYTKLVDKNLEKNFPNFFTGGYNPFFDVGVRLPFKWSSIQNYKQMDDWKVEIVL